MATVDGPEIVPIELPPEGDALRKLFLADLDKCHCEQEIFEKEDHCTFLFLVGYDLRSIRNHFPRVAVPLREQPLTVHDFWRCFAAAYWLADDTPLEEKNLVTSARLVPPGSKLEGIEVPGLVGPLSVAEPLYLGQWIQNYSRFGLFLNVNSISRCMELP